MNRRFFTAAAALFLLAQVPVFALKDEPAPQLEAPPLDLSRSYEAFNKFEQECGTKTQFKTDKCYALHKQIMRDFWTTVSGE